MKSVIDQIREFDPSYNPIETARLKVGISAETLNNAADRVFIDGYYGPISPDTWKEQDGREPSSVTEAIEIMRKVADEVEDWWDKDDGEFGFDYNSRVDSADIVKASWPFLTEIYGGLPF